MTTLAEFPGPVLRGVPSFRFTVPDGFTLGEAPSSLAVLRADEAVGGFTANLIVNHDRIVADATLRDAAVLTGAQLARTAAKLEITEERVADLPGRSTYIRAAKVTPHDSELVLHQIHAIVLAPAPDHPTQTRDLIHLVGTCNALPDDKATRYGLAFVEVIKTFAFTDA